MFIMLAKVIVWCLNALDDSFVYIMDYDTVMFMICMEGLAAIIAAMTYQVISNTKK